MNKFLIYAPVSGFMPKGMNDVLQYAKDNLKFRIANVELNGHLASVKPGDNIITGKGNSLYVVKAFATSLDKLSEEDSSYIDTLTREYGMKKMNITSVDTIIKFETWCKTAKPIINNKKENKMNSKSIADRMKSMFMPTEAEGVRIATDGNICVATDNGYVAINAANELTAYPEELTISLPVYVISKPKEQLQVGDVIALDRSYAKITKIGQGGKISAIGYTGTGKTIHTIKDVLFNQTMVRVVVSLAGNLGGTGINPMMLMLMNKDEKNDNLLPLLMMTQQGGTVGMNPMMMLALSGGDKLETKDLLMMSMMSGQNPFAIPQAPTAPVAPATPTAPAEPSIEE